MEIVLTATEARVLGCLIEKQLTTPQYYPLSLNSLTTACNQKNNRSPVMSVSEGEVTSALDKLRSRGLVYRITGAGGRVPKYEHNMKGFSFTPAEIAIVCELLVRGPQTSGELRAHGSRIFDFADLGEVELAVSSLMSRSDGPYVAQLPRQSGTKESRFAHLFCGPPDEDAARPDTTETVVALPGQGLDERVSRLEQGLDQLRAEVETLRGQFETFRRQFE